MIALENLTAAPPLLQSMLLLLQQYDTIIKYRPGSKIQFADALSGLYSVRQRDEILLYLHVNHIVFSSTRPARVGKETNSCLVLSTVYRLTHNRWPITHRKVPRIALKYWDMREKLTLERGLLLKGCRIIIPTALRDSFLHELHEEHAGITKWQLMAGSLNYWSGIDRGIRHYIKQCPICTKLLPTQKQDPLSATKSQIIDVNFIDWECEKYLLIIVYCSEYLLLYLMFQQPKFCYQPLNRIILL